MLKKIITLVIAICIITSTATAFAKEESLYTEMQNIIEGYTAKISIQKPEAFSGIINCYDRAKTQNIQAYISFIYKEGFNASEMQIINRVLANGTTVQSLIEVYNFWLTTDESFDMIEKICALEDRYFSEHWYEDAFNKLTDYDHGELSVDDIINYRGQGITTDEILTANVMSRKAGQNIVAILDAHIDGNTIESQIAVLYGVTELSDEESLFSSVTAIACKSKRQNNQLFALKTGERAEEFANIISDKVKSEIKRLGITEDNPEDAFSDYEALKNSGYPINVQRALMNKGYTPEEILKSAQFTQDTLHEAAKKAREMIKNEK